jgi:hypothetical protein
MEVRVKCCGIGAEGVNGERCTRNTLFQSDDLPQKDQQAPPGAPAKSAKQGPVILKIDPQHFGDAENNLPMRHRIEYVFIQVMPQDNRPFSLACRTTTPAFA